MHESCPHCEAPTDVVREPGVFMIAPTGTLIIVTVSVENEFSRCPNCGEEFYTPDQSLVHSERIKSALKEKGVDWPQRVHRRRTSTAATPEAPTDD